ncbi:MAG: glycosyltransferase family 4 protein [Gammaproteobacteria bacterium]|nr:glycosyltransferase family 4 protein [Gammaproteobacteria bacterium]
MNILLVTNAYPPEIRSASQLMFELATELHRQGHQVTVVTSWPRYNLDEKQKSVVYQEWLNEAGIDVLRIKVLKHHNVNFVMRGIAEWVMPFLYLFKIKKYCKKPFDKVIVYSPPINLGFVGAWLKSTGAEFILNVQDLFPQNAIDLGVLTNRWLIKVYRWLESYLYRHADQVTFHSKGNQEMSIARYDVLRDKSKVVHNWIDVKRFQKPVVKDYRELFGLQDKFVFVFAGVMGPSQNLLAVVQAFEQLQDLEDVVFLMVGDGADKQTLVDYVNSRGLKNILFKPFIAADDYVDLLKACDAGIVSLSPKNKTPVVPGKILGYMAAGLPVVAFLNKESDGHEIIREAQCGVSVVSDDVEGMILSLRECVVNNSLSSERGLSGTDYVKQHFEQKYCVNELLSQKEKELQCFVVK